MEGTTVKKEVGKVVENDGRGWGRSQEFRKSMGKSPRGKKGAQKFSKF